MKTLRLNDNGEEVIQLQRHLRDAYFSTRAIDGDFGPTTFAAVIGFQKVERGRVK